jgi:hypothetical protein
MKLKFWTTVRRPMCLGVGLPSRTQDQIFFSVWQLWISWCLAPSLTRGSVIHLYNFFWALPEQSLSGPSPAELTTILYCLIWDSPNPEGHVPVFISASNRVAQLYLRALGSLIVAFMTRRATVVGHSNFWGKLKPKLKSRYNWRSVDQSVSTSWCRANCGTCEQILILSEICLVSVGRLLWREVGSVSYHSLSAAIAHRQVPPFPIFYFNTTRIA